MKNIGFDLKAVDRFKKYPDYKGQYIIEYYIRHTWCDSVYRSYDDLDDALHIMDDMNLWDDYMLGYIRDDGYPSFHLEL